jgi:hypothetical protein
MRLAGKGRCSVNPLVRFFDFCSYFPFNAKLCLNGHKYAKRQFAQEGIAFEALDNGILKGANPQRLQAICDGFPRQDRCAPAQMAAALAPPFTAPDRKAGYRYDISIPGGVLHHPSARPAGARPLFFEQVIRENLDLGRSEEVPQGEPCTAHRDDDQ